MNSTEDDTNLLSSAQQRKSAAQLRRRQRKERRSTGLPELRACEVGVDVSDDESDFSEQSSDVDVVSECREADRSDDDHVVTESAIFSSAVKPSGSPKLLRKRRSRSGSLQRKQSNIEKRRNSAGNESEKAEARSQDDDTEYDALVRRLQKRLNKKRDIEEPTTNERAEASESPIENKETRIKNNLPQPEQSSNEHVSLVDMFAVSKKKPIAPTDEDDASSNVHDVPVSDETLSVRRRNRSSIEESQPVTKRESIPSPAAQQPTEATSLLRHNPVRTSAGSNTNQEVAQEQSFWRRCLGIFSCFVVFCGFWKCFSK